MLLKNKITVFSLIMFGMVSLCPVVNAMAPEWKDVKNEHDKYKNVTIGLKNHSYLKDYKVPNTDTESLNEYHYRQRDYFFQQGKEVRMLISSIPTSEEVKRTLFTEVESKEKDLEKASAELHAKLINIPIHISSTGQHAVVPDINTFNYRCGEFKAARQDFHVKCCNIQNLYKSYEPIIEIQKELNKERDDWKNKKKWVQLKGSNGMSYSQQMTAEEMGAPAPTFRSIVEKKIKEGEILSELVANFY